MLGLVKKFIIMKAWFKPTKLRAKYADTQLAFLRFSVISTKWENILIVISCFAT